MSTNMHRLRADFVGYLLDSWILTTDVNFEYTGNLMERPVSVLVCFSAAQAVERE